MLSEGESFSDCEDLRKVKIALIERVEASLGAFDFSLEILPFEVVILLEDSAETTIQIF